MSVGQSGMLRAHTLFREGNYGEAVALFSAGAREGNTRALFNLAYCLQYGYGVQADPARAFGLYQHLLYEEDGDLYLSIYAPENAGTEEINYNPVILGIQENDAVRRQVAVSQKAKSA